MIEVQELHRGINRKKRVTKMLDELRHGSVIVEGKHDINALMKLGVNAISCNSVIKGAIKPDLSSTVFILTDNDKGGEIKSNEIKSSLLSMNSAYRINEELGRKMYKMLNIRCVEQIHAPAIQALEYGDNNGKNVFRHSKIYDRGKVFDRRISR